MASVCKIEWCVSLEKKIMTFAKEH
jgi:hypothetical protein